MHTKSTVKLTFLLTTIIIIISAFAVILQLSLKIDAMLSNGLARYANHSCNPNCVVESVQIDQENKILIIANRRILRE